MIGLRVDSLIDLEVHIVTVVVQSEHDVVGRLSVAQVENLGPELV